MLHITRTQYQQNDLAFCLRIKLYTDTYIHIIDNQTCKSPNYVYYWEKKSSWQSSLWPKARLKTIPLWKKKTAIKNQFYLNWLVGSRKKYWTVHYFSHSQVFHLKITVDLMKMINSSVLRGENSAAEDTLFSLTNPSNQSSLDVKHTFPRFLSRDLACKKISNLFNSFQQCLENLDFYFKKMDRHEISINYNPKLAI